jgi:hypothetical protein
VKRLKVDVYCLDFLFISKSGFEVTNDIELALSRDGLGKEFNGSLDVK